MHRDHLKDLLNNYYPKDPQEIIAKQHMLALLSVCTNCFDRACTPGHFTASSWLLSKDSTKSLLLQHAKLKRWLQLGGHCDGEADVLKVAVKEAQEESGINAIEPISAEIFDIDMHLIPQNKNDTPHYHYDIRFLLQVKSDESLISNHESLALQWFEHDVTTFPTQDMSIIRMLNKALIYLESKQQPVLGD